MQRLGVAEWFAVGRAISAGQLTRYGDAPGGEVARFEVRLGAKMGVNHALAMSSGTSALIAALAAARIGPGDEVLVPAYTWLATAAAPLAVGAVPVLVDIDETLTMDPKDIERRLSPHTKAIIVVHMGNAVCDMDAILAIARARNLLVIEDAAQAVGVTYKGKRCGTMGAIGALSFNKYKNMNSAEGGAVLTDDPQLYARARIYHDCGDFGRGQDTFNEPAFIGQNYKANEIQGAILNVQLGKLDPFLARLRRRRQVLAGFLGPRSDSVITPHNDAASACSLSLLFHREADAVSFSQNRGVTRLLDSSKHVFTNWESVLAKRAFHPAMNPHAWAKREISYDADSYRRTLDILARTCRVELGGRWPLPVVWAYGRWLAGKTQSVAQPELAPAE
jgi:dTDP-4-amino-4,6-dideoxygalactose transaminase